MKLLDWIVDALNSMKEGDLQAVRKLIHFEDHTEAILGIGNEDGLDPHEAATEFIRAVNAEDRPH